MNPIKYFLDFIKEGVVKKKFPDLSRADFLIKEAEKSYLSLGEIVEKIGINNRNANSIIKLSYDVIMESIRAIMLKKGLSSSGLGAHEAEVSYLRDLEFSEIDVQFTDRLRYFRNSITYYGKMLGLDYAEKVYAFLQRVYPRLKKTLM